MDTQLTIVRGRGRLSLVQVISRGHRAGGGRPGQAPLEVAWAVTRGTRQVSPPRSQGSLVSREEAPVPSQTFGAPAPFHKSALVRRKQASSELLCGSGKVERVVSWPKWLAVQIQIG